MVKFIKSNEVKLVESSSVTLIGEIINKWINTGSDSILLSKKFKKSSHLEGGMSVLGWERRR